VAAFFLASRLAQNPALAPHISLLPGIEIWLADVALVLLMGVHPLAARLALPVASILFPVPMFLNASPFARFGLMIFMGVPWVIATAWRFAPAKPGGRTRFAFFFSWFGTQKIEFLKKRRLNLPSVIHVIIAGVVFDLALNVLKSASPVGLSLLLCWLACGVAIFSFAEMLTATHVFITALLGIHAPALMRSPWLSTSVNEFWTRRWNIALSVLCFRPFFFGPLARRGIVPALFAAFLASAILHVLACFQALVQWPISLAFGAFFLVQPLLILAERALRVRRWPVSAARTWTLTALAVTSPLFIEPMTQIVMPDLSAADTVLPATILMFGVAIGLNLFMAVGQLLFCRSTTDGHG
jgi:hypothetical protein